MRKKSVTIRGVTYPTIKDACAKYGISFFKFYNRKKKGWDDEKCLIRENLSCVVSKDFKGKRFKSITDMAKEYGLKPYTVSFRLAKGWSLEDALTIPKATQKRGICHDHTGRKFYSVGAMCAFWNIPTARFYSRRSTGWSLKKALTEPSKRQGRKKE